MTDGSWKKGQAGINEPEATLPEGATDFGPFKEPENEQTEIEIQRCKTCGGSLIPHSLSPKPSWANIMRSNHRPHWYTRCRAKKKLEYFLYIRYHCVKQVAANDKVQRTIYPCVSKSLPIAKASQRHPDKLQFVICLNRFQEVP